MSINAAWDLKCIVDTKKESHKLWHFILNSLCIEWFFRLLSLSIFFLIRKDLPVCNPKSYEHPFVMLT